MMARRHGFRCQCGFRDFFYRQSRSFRILHLNQSIQNRSQFLAVRLGSPGLWSCTAVATVRNRDYINCPCFTSIFGNWSRRCYAFSLANRSWEARICRGENERIITVRFFTSVSAHSWGIKGPYCGKGLFQRIRIAPQRQC